MKTALFAVGVGMSAVAWAAQTITWTGLGDGKSFGDEANWSERPTGHAWIARFTNSVSVVLDRNLTFASGGSSETALIGGYKVEKGDVYISKADSGFNTGVNGNDPYVDVAADAKLVCSNKFSYYNFGTFHKRGAGLWQMVGNELGGEHVWHLDFEEGKTEFVRFANVGRCSTTNAIVRAGAELALVNATMDDRMVLTLEKDAVLRITGGSNEANIANLQGEGDVIGEPSTDGQPWSRLKLTLKVAAARPFTGTFSGQFGVSFDKPAAGVGCFVPSRADLLADSVIIKGDGLRFRPLPEVNEVKCFSGFYSGALYLKDADDNPVTVRTVLDNTGYSMFYGPGNLWVKNSTTLYQSLYHATGFLGVCSGATLNVGSGGDVNYDFDFSGAGISGVYCEEGAGVQFFSVGGNNKRVKIPVRSFGNAALSFGGSQALAFEDIHFTATNTVAASSGVEFAGGEMVFTRFAGGGGTALSTKNRRFTGAKVYAPKTLIAADTRSVLPKPNGIVFSGDNGWYTSVITDGELYRATTDGGHKEHHMQGGKTYFGPGAEMSATAGALADGGNPKIVFDGGTAVCYNRTDDSDFSFPGNNAKYDLQVTSRGGRLEVACYPESACRYYNVVRPLMPASGDEPDGGLTFSGHGYFSVYYPMQLTGPISLMDGAMRVAANVYSAGVSEPFGAGDLVLRNARLLVYSDVTTRQTLKLATGEGSALVVAGSATIHPRWNGTQACQDVVIGDIRREKGGVLFVRLTGGDALGAGGSSVKVQKGLALQASGLPRLPIVAGEMSTDAFVTYDAADGLKPFANYAVNDFTQGADSVVQLTDSLTVSADASVAGVHYGATFKTLTIADGKTLTVGNGTDPAMILLGVVGVLAGPGTLNFGSSEGVLVGNNTTGTHPCEITAKVSGTGGLTLTSTAVNDQDYKIQLHNGANDYTGGTWVHAVNVWANDPRCFSTGEVFVGGGDGAGGSVFLVKAGTYANAFRIAGKGGSRIGFLGAVCFKADAEMSGVVEMYEDARVTAADGIRGTVSGVLSGAKLQVRNANGAHGGTVVLAGHNVYTGGTEVVAAAIAVKEADGFGTGDVTIDGSVLEFVNTAAIAIPNKIEGVGTVKLSGTGKVTLAGDHSDFVAGLDMMGENLTLAEMPDFVTGLANSAGTRCKLMVPAGATLSFAGYEVGGLEKVEIVLGAGATLDLGGKSLSARRLTGDPSQVVNGTLTELNPKRGLLMVVR